jgi:hypothetical protein
MKTKFSKAQQKAKYVEDDSNSDSEEEIPNFENSNI